MAQDDGSGREDPRRSIAAAVDDLLALIEPRVASLESTPADRAPHLAAAGLVHCCSLLRGIRAVRLAGLPYLAAPLTRQLWEASVVALHLALRGEDAVKVIEADDIYWKRRFPEKLRPAAPYQPDWEGTPAKLNIRDLADQLPALLQAQGEPERPDLPTAYDLIYRVQSLFGVHAGLATLGAYIAYSPTTWRLIMRPDASFRLVEQTPALLTAHLAQYVFKAFRADVPDLDPIVARLHQATED